MNKVLLLMTLLFITPLVSATISETYLGETNIPFYLQKVPSTYQVLTHENIFLEFNEQEYISIPDSDDLSSPNEMGSFFTWTKFNPDTSGGWMGRQFVFGKGYPDNYEYALVKFDDGLGYSSLVAQVHNLSKSQGKSIFITSPIEYDKWYFVGFSVDQENLLTYIDGNFETRSNIADFLDMENGNSDLRIGSRDINPLNGSIDGFYMANRSLTQGEIMGIYRNNPKSEMKIPYLMYHRVDSPAEPFEVDPNDLRDQMQFLKDGGFETISSIDYDNWRQGIQELPEKPIMLVFDDGHDSVYYSAAEILADFDYIGIVAVIVNLTENTNPTSETMNWTEVNNLVDEYGWDVVSHSFNHCRHDFGESGAGMTYCNTPEERELEFNLSKKLIYDRTGILPVMYVFPGNSFGVTSAANAQEIYEHCQQHYSLCSGPATTMGDGFSGFLDKDSGFDYLYAENNFYRIGVQSTATINDFQYTLNWSFPEELSVNMPMNENSGNQIHDLSGNNNHGIIQNPIWKTNENIITLNQEDYLLFRNIFTLLDPTKAWQEIIIEYTPKLKRIEYPEIQIQ